MLPSRWLSYLRENSLSEDRSTPALLSEMNAVARNCCQGTAEPVDWRSLARHQSMQLRAAYTYLREFERALPPGHPARPSCRTLRNLLLAIRESMLEIKTNLPSRNLALVEKEAEAQRKAFLALGKGVAVLDTALESVHCRNCASWHPGRFLHCPKCRGPLHSYRFARDDRPDDQQMAGEYALLRQLADQVHQNPDAGQPLREHALQIAELLKSTIEPTRRLAQVNPSAPVDEMVDYLRAARAAVLEMADWPAHRDPRRLERGWLLIRDQLGRFEQALEDHEPA
ncbi:MAG: hypothetical protein U0931_04465 [Vulcanimicrobiota bacterium]